MPQGDIENVTMEDVKIIFRNFAGKEGRFNREGDRNFAVLLADDVAEAMAADGWVVKRLKPREEGDIPQAYIPVAVKYGRGRPPRVVLITSRGRNPLSEEEIEVLDWVDIRTVDLIVRPYEWNVNGDTGIKAYLKSMFVIIEEDALDLKYADLDDMPARAGRTEE